ncbi:hypothetical protein BLNAU_17688 [Blattamonas nauphoetae]|uniref:Uncharacterized protein n=1 Tax=Blattamonas nauphoetae TaxID=2049346 RepID=A0ABQ9X6Z2_9EUKA|nr:hypothetical protein BLNAU_17688 [Blattamonas nauphoetae]
MLYRNTRLVQYRSDEATVTQATEFMVSIRRYLHEPEQYTERADLWDYSGSVPYFSQQQLEKDSERFSSYIVEWTKDRENPNTIWRGVLTAIFQCLTNSWVTSDHRFRKLWRNIRPHWATFVIDFNPIVLTPTHYDQGISSREQCLHWILVKFHKAATTLLEQGIAPKLLVHLDRTESDNFISSDLKILFVCLRMRRVRVLHFHHPLLEEGLEDAAEMVSFHNNAPIADYAQHVLILRPIGSKLIPLMKFHREYRPNVSRLFTEFHPSRRDEDDDYALTSDDETPIDVEKAAEKRAIRGQENEESSSEDEDGQRQTTRRGRRQYQSKVSDDSEEFSHLQSDSG